MVKNLLRIFNIIDLHQDLLKIIFNKGLLRDLMKNLIDQRKLIFQPALRKMLEPLCDY